MEQHEGLVSHQAWPKERPAHHSFRTSNKCQAACPCFCFIPTFHPYKQPRSPVWCTPAHALSANGTRNLFVCIEIKYFIMCRWKHIPVFVIRYAKDDMMCLTFTEMKRKCVGASRTFALRQRKCERLVIWGNSVSLNSFIGPFRSNSAGNTHLRMISFWKVQVGFLHFINTRLMDSAVVLACFAEHHYILCLCSCLSQCGM